MGYSKITISSGHGLKVRGASGYLDEVNEARKVVNKVAEYLRQLGITVNVFHDDTATTVNQNLSAIVGFHNRTNRELDVSVHFNANRTTSNPMGTEVCYYDASGLASTVSQAIASAGGFKNRGGKQRQELYFLRNTNKPAILIETCFVDSSADRDLYNRNFDAICRAIAETLSGKKLSQPTPQPAPTQPTPAQIPTNLYRVRKTWDDAKSQIGAYGDLDNAKQAVNENPEYKAFDSNGNVVYEVKKNVDHMYRVRKSWEDAGSQIGAFRDLQNGIDMANLRASEGYKVFDENGNVVYTPQASQPAPTQPEVTPEPTPTPQPQPEPTPQPEPEQPQEPVETHEGHNAIVGKSEISADKMVAFVKTVNQNAQDIDKIAKAFVEIGDKYGIRGDVAFCQSLIETGWFKFDGGTEVTPDQHNYFGCGVLQKGMKGNSFDTVEIGVEAQIQHLYGYAIKEQLDESKVVDPRYKYLVSGGKLGIAPHWEDLNNRWAMNTHYGQDIMALYNKLVNFEYVPPVEEAPVEQKPEQNDQEQQLSFWKKVIDYLFEKLSAFFGKK